MIEEKLPRCSLGFFPTPLVEMRRLSQRLGGPRLWIKRDDLTGLAFGGNKTRKLEFLLAEALAQGCDSVQRNPIIVVKPPPERLRSVFRVTWRWVERRLSWPMVICF